MSAQKRTKQPTTKCIVCEGQGKAPSVLGCISVMASDVCNACNGLGWLVDGERLGSDQVIMYYRDKVRRQYSFIKMLQHKIKILLDQVEFNPYDGVGRYKGD